MNKCIIPKANMLYLQSWKDQMHFSQFELPQQVPELADHRVIYGADMVAI